MRRKQFDDTTKNKTKKSGVCIAVFVILLIIGLSVFGFFAAKASTDKIYSGISVGNIDFGGMDVKSAEKKLADIYDADYDIALKFKCDEAEFEIYSSQVNLKADIASTAKKLVDYGKEGSIFSKIKSMRRLEKKPESLNIDIICDEDVLQYLINENLPDSVVDVQQYSVVIGEDCLIVNNGKNGMGADMDDVLESICEKITLGTTDDIIEFRLEETYPEKIDPDKFYQEYNRDAKDAESVQNGDDLTIIPEQVGIELDKDEVFDIIDKNVGSDKEYTIPAVIKYPKITAVELEKKYADTVIGTYTTDYASSSENRKENIRLASEKMNGMYLNPGEVFSFNDVVGPRTEATGFKVAHVYSGNEVVDGIGGGICQVSSTLYNAVVLADLEIVYRMNHSIPVTYVPLGRDATVSYGTIDFKFKNNKSTPVKIEAVADGANLTINIYGRAKDKKEVSIETSILGTVEFSTNEIKDDTMYEDERVVVKAGTNGTSIESFKIISENGQVVSRTPLAKSNYSPTSATVKTGTKKREAQQAEPAPVTGQQSDGNSQNTSDEENGSVVQNENSSQMTVQ